MWEMKGQGTASIATSYLRVVTLYASKIKHNLDYWTLIALNFLEQRSLKIHIKSFCSLELIKAIYWDIPSIFKLVFWSKKITKVARFFHDIFLVTQC